MRIFEHDATPLLCQKVKSIRHERESWRCMHLKLSGERARHNRMLRTNFVIKGIRELLAGHDCYVYLCQDADIVILFQGRAKPLMQKLSRQFADMGETYNEDDENGLFSVYDLSKDWLYLFVLCHRKLAREEAASTQDNSSVFRSLQASGYAEEVSTVL